MPSTRHQTSTHWGPYEAEVENGQVIALHPSPVDPNPSPIGLGMPQAINDKSRIEQPMIRKGWLDNGPGAPGRGGDPFVAVSWQKALDLASAELDRVRTEFGNEAIYAGSYGWASAGRFHHAQSQLKRFLNLAGGFTDSKNTYSFAVGEVLLPRVLGITQWEVVMHATSLSVIAEHGELVVMFGGMAPKNSQVEGGGFGKHEFLDRLAECRANGVKFVNFSPIRADGVDLLDAEWHCPRPNTDAAIMLGLAHTLVAEGLHDQAFLDRYSTGFDKFLPYLMGDSDGQPKDADWAAAISGLDGETLRSLARRMAGSRTMITASWSIQRGDHGEQPYWMVATLAAMLGQIGLPGGGLGYGYGAVNAIGRPPVDMPRPVLSQGKNPVKSYIPVARITDLLENPGATLDYDGERITFPDIKIVYWCGGNPFHHHQDLNHLVKAWQRPDTVITHEPWWNGLARHADIVFPVTSTLERNDVACSRSDRYLIAMHKAVEAVGDARNDFDVFSDLSERLGFRDAFTEGRTEMEWLRHLYDRYRQQLAERKVEAPSFDDFWEAGHFAVDEGEPVVLLKKFRDDPVANPVATPSGKIEIYSETIAGFDYDDCPGHPVWIEPAEWLGSDKAETYPLHLISNQPPARLHSQYDNGGASQAQKIHGREPMTINPVDAQNRGIVGGDLVRVFNDRGACISAAIVSDIVTPGVIQLPTGAWFDPAEPGQTGSLERHGNPNVLTMDKGTSKLAQAPIAHSALVEVERYTGDAPAVGAFVPPPIIRS